MKRNLCRPTIAIVMTSVLTSVLSVGVAQSQPVLPPAFDGLDARIVHTDRDWDGHELYVDLPDGTMLDVDLDRNGAWQEVSAEGWSFLPEILVTRLLPQAVIANPAFLALQSVHEVEAYPWGYEVEGIDVNGGRIELEFASDGALLERSFEGRHDSYDGTRASSDRWEDASWDDDHWDREDWDDNPRDRDADDREHGRSS